MQKVKVEFLKAGKWHDNPWEPQFTAETGDQHMVTAQLANVLLEAGAAKYVTQDEPVKSFEPDNPADAVVSDLQLSEAVIKKLAENEITTVKQLTEKTAEELAEIKGLGQAKIDDIQEALTLAGLSLQA